MSSVPKRTLWERIVGQGKTVTVSTTQPQIRQPVNLLRTKLDGYITVDWKDYGGKNYCVKEIREVVRKINNKEHKWIDYTLQDEDLIFRLRTSPNVGKEAAVQVLLLDLYADEVFDQELLDICEKGDEFCVTDHDRDDEASTYYRYGGVKEADKCRVSVFTRGGLNECKVDCWCFSRMTNDEADNKYEQFLFVEMDLDSGRFQLWRGEEIEFNRITVF